MKVSMLTGGYDKHYVAGLMRALAGKGIELEIIGGSDNLSVDGDELPNVKQLKFRVSTTGRSALYRIYTWCLFYGKLMKYVSTSQSEIVHIVWNNKIEWFDRTVLMAYYKAFGKKIALTAHNVNAGVRDNSDSWWNRLTLRVQYQLSDCIFVHTEKMKTELMREFGVSPRSVSVIPFGINDSIEDTAITSEEARRVLGFNDDDKIILFFGALRAYKGLEYLVKAFFKLAAKDPHYRLIVAGEPRKEDREYLDRVLSMIEGDPNGYRVHRDLRHIPDRSAELYFKAADVAALPYTHIFQSGVLFLAYGFGLPVVASRVGSMDEDVIEEKTGLLCQPRSAVDLAWALETYFASDLYKALPESRERIRSWAEMRNSWRTVGEITSKAYENMLARKVSTNEKLVNLKSH